jgi:hypothetical protein
MENHILAQAQDAYLDLFVNRIFGIIFFDAEVSSQKIDQEVKRHEALKGHRVVFVCNSCSKERHKTRKQKGFGGIQLLDAWEI